MKFIYSDFLSEEEFGQIVRWLLIAFSVPVFFSLIGSFASYDAVVSNGHPWLPVYTCPGCFLCGMTRSFCAMSSGLWAEAWNWNKGGPVLYSLGWFWMLFLLITLIRKNPGLFKK